MLLGQQGLLSDPPTPAQGQAESSCSTRARGPGAGSEAAKLPHCVGISSLTLGRVFKLIQ